MKKSNSSMLGWIGTGILGSAIVKKLLRDDFKISVYNRTKAKIKELLSDGAVQAGSIKSIFLQTKIIFVCLGNQEAFSDLILKNIAILNPKKKPIILVDLSTVSPEFAMQIYNTLKQYNINYIESPVSGGREGALNGVMTAICSGDLKAFEKTKKVLNIFCSNVHYVGESGNAQKLKIINNLAESINLLCASEVILLGLKLGFNINTLRTVLKTARGKSAYMEILLERLCQKTDDVAVTLDVRVKDLCLAESLLMQTNIDLSLSKITIDFFKTTKKSYGLKADQTKCFEQLQNLKILAELA